jgi:hypothetical protein
MEVKYKVVEVYAAESSMDVQTTEASKKLSPP